MELNADDGRRRLEAARAEGLALAVELQKSRERHRDEILRLVGEHDGRLKECANRLCADTAISQPRSRNLGQGGTVTAAAALAPPVVSAINELTEQLRACVEHEDRKQYHRRSPARDGRHLKGKADSRRDGRGDRINFRQKLLVTNFLRDTATRLDAECSRAVRHARALEWELRGVRQEAADAAAALEEVRAECARLSVRAAVAEAAVVAASCDIPATGSSSAGYPNPVASSIPESSSGGLKFVVSGVAAGGGERGGCTIAAVSLLEKRFSAAVEDLVAAAAARSAAEAGESAATARAEAAEGEATSARATVDVLRADLERHKASVADKMTTEGSEWRREIRAELGRWWHDDLVSGNG